MSRQAATHTVVAVLPSTALPDKEIRSVVNSGYSFEQASDLARLYIYYQREARTLHRVLRVEIEHAISGNVLAELKTV